MDNYHPTEFTINLFNFSLDTLEGMSKDLAEDIVDEADFYSAEEIEELKYLKNSIDYFIRDNYVLGDM